jgi:Zn-dependent membrane protease YugP
MLTAGLAWALVGGVSILPFLASSVALAIDAAAGHRRRGPELPEVAGRWLEGQIAASGLPLHVEVHPSGGFDAWWPSVSAIGLSARTWAGTRPADWAIAAHELGHAMAAADDRIVAQVYAVARATAGLAWRVCAAALLVAAAFGDPWVPTVAYVALVWAIGAQGLVVVDEANASLRGLVLVAGDARVPVDAHRIAARALIGAFAVYGSGWLAELAVLGTWPTVERLVLGAPHLGLPAPPPAAVWVGLAFVPLLVLRAMSVLAQVWSPEPVTTDFQLLSRLQRERAWELATAASVAVLLVTLGGSSTGRAFSTALVFAASTVVGPAAEILRSLLTVPLAFVLRGWLARERASGPPLLPRPAPDEAAPALMALYTQPPWTVRLIWLAHLLYVPLLVLLALELLS